METDMEYCQAKFVINALKDGWIVKMQKDGSLVFLKERADDMTSRNYTRKFLEKYGKIKG